MFNSRLTAMRPSGFTQATGSPIYLVHAMWGTVKTAV